MYIILRKQRDNYMNLPSPISINLPINSGTITRTFNELPLILIDNSKLKKVQAQMPPFYKLLTLWENESYNQIGDYTQSQAEARVLELLGNNPASGLLQLYINPSIKKKNL